MCLREDARAWAAMVPGPLMTWRMVQADGRGGPMLDWRGQGFAVLGPPCWQPCREAGMGGRGMGYTHGGIGLRPYGVQVAGMAPWGRPLCTDTPDSITQPLKGIADTGGVEVCRARLDERGYKLGMLLCVAIAKGSVDTLDCGSEV